MKLSSDSKGLASSFPLFPKTDAIHLEQIYTQDYLTESQWDLAVSQLENSTKINTKRTFQFNALAITGS